MSLREFIQNKLEELTINDEDLTEGDFSIEVGTEVPDDMLVLNQVYFSYLLNNDLLNSDFDLNGTYNVSIVGYIKVKMSKDVDSLKVIDIAQNKIKNKLKEINFRTSFYDVSIIDDIRKIQVKANARYNEINNGII